MYIPPEYSRYSSPVTFTQIENEYLEFTDFFLNICLIGDFNARIAEEDEFITIDQNILFETFDDFIENPSNVLQQLNSPLNRSNVDKGKKKNIAIFYLIYVGGMICLL